MIYGFRHWLFRALVRLAVFVHPAAHMAVLTKVTDRKLSVGEMEEASLRAWGPSVPLRRPRRSVGER